MTVSDRYPMEELLPVVARLAAKYSSGSSTSVTMERAQQLMEAVLYCIRENEHLCEKSGSDEKNLQNSRNMTAQEAYENGYRMVLEKTDRARNLYHELIQNFTDYGNQSLHDTVILGIPAFFRYYDAEIDPQNQILTLDYPTIWPVGELCGVDAIYHYLKCLRMEQMFLDGIPDETVKKILEAYCADYREQFDNVCSIVLRYVLTKMHKKCKRGAATDGLYRDFSVLLGKLIREKYDDNEELYRYLQYELKDLSVRILAGLPQFHRSFTDYVLT